MAEFNNVTVIKKANIYLDGQVVSRSVLFPDGAKKTLGIMQPGNTSSALPTRRSWKS